MLNKITVNSGFEVFRYYAFAKALLLLSLLHSCKQQPDYVITTVAGKQLAIDSELSSADSIAQFIEPYRKGMEKGMDEQLSYSPVAMAKNDYPLNTPIGNMMAAIVRRQVSPVYKSRTGNAIDAVLLNHGGVRAALAAGPVTMRDAYEIMPFENKIVVAEMNATQVKQMVDYLVAGQKAHPFDGMEIHLDASGKLREWLIGGAVLDNTRIYHVATSDYLYNGGDNMTFFANTASTDTDYKLRNAMIDYFKEVDTLNFTRDNRFIKDPTP